MKPICVHCQRFYRPKKTGTAFIEGMPTHNGAAAGTREPQSWKPYKLWLGDLWQCPDCKAEIIVGCGRNAIAEHFEPDFEKQVESWDGAHLQINDC